MPHTTTGVSPAELLINRRPRSFLFPDVSGGFKRCQRKQKENHDNSKTLRMFAPGDKILAKNFRSSNHLTSIKSIIFKSEKRVGDE